MPNLSRAMIAVGSLLLAGGLLLMLGEKTGLRPGRLPGDIVVRGRNSVFYFPLATSLILSLLATLVLWLWKRR